MSDEEPEAAPVAEEEEEAADAEQAPPAAPLASPSGKPKKPKSIKKSNSGSKGKKGSSKKSEGDGGDGEKKKKKSKKATIAATADEDNENEETGSAEKKPKSKKMKKKKSSKNLTSGGGSGGGGGDDTSDDNDDILAPKKPKSTKKKKKGQSKSLDSSNRSGESKGLKRKTSTVQDVQPRYRFMTQSAAMANQIKQSNTTTESTEGVTSALLDKAMRSINNDIDQVLHEGITVWKITSGGNWESRIVTLAPGNQVFLVTHKKLKLSAKDNMMRVAAKLPIPIWTPSKGLGFASGPSYVRYIDVADLDGWNIGVVGTQTLELARNKVMSKIKKDLDNSVQDIISIYHNGHQSLNLVVEDANHRKALVKALHKLYSTYRSIDTWIGNDALLLRYIWYDIDGDKNELISQKEFSQICARINFYLKNSSQLFDEFVSKNLVGRKELTYRECTTLLESMKPEQPGTVIWKELFGHVETIGPEELLDQFLHGCQGEKDTKLKDAQALLLCINTMELEADKMEDSQQQQQEEEDQEQAEPETEAKKQQKKKKEEGRLTKKQFTAFLNSDLNDAFDPEQQRLPTGPLTKPLSHYWINTSHNTYLTGDQLQSRSSAEAYIRALLRGCKCLELDCWDGPSLNEVFYIPVVFHGHTLTSKIEFRHIILAVNNFLEASPNSYPIILSLENHCSHSYQRAMAMSMMDIFGDKLFVPTPEQLAGDQPLPSPEELRGKVVIKGKRPPEKDDADDTEQTEGELSGAEEEEDDDPFSDAYQDEEEMDEGENPVTDTGSPTKEVNKPPKVHPELSKLTLFHGTKFKSFDKSIKQDYSHMHSIGETKIIKIISKEDDGAKMWRRYNVDHMTRTYPAGARVDSSNYNPTLAWAMGCQLVALNFQTHDVPLLLNDGRFRQNGGCGYVLKPKGVMNCEHRAPSKTFKIKVLGGNCLPKPNGAKKGETIDPYVIVELHDVAVNDDETEEYSLTTHTTDYIDDNGFCPVWKDTGKEFTVQNPEVAIFLFKMLDKDVLADDKIAAAAIPVSCLRPGYRSIQLLDHANSRTGAFRYATLLIKVDVV